MRSASVLVGDGRAPADPTRTAGGRFRRTAAVAGVALAALAAMPGAALSQTDGCVAAPQSYDSGGSPGATFPDDPLYPRQWGLRQIRVPEAWARGFSGKGAVVAVVDSGVDLAHPDLERKLVPGVDLLEGGPGEAPDCPPGPQDDYFHGTMVAGIVAASTDNGVGVAGVAPKARVMPIKIGGPPDGSLVDDGSWEDRIVEGIRYAADHGADVINLSVVLMPQSYTPLGIARIEAAVEYAWKRGSVIVAAAGNHNLPICQQPSGSTRAVCVIATDRQGNLASYTDLPVVTRGIAVAAPGGDFDEDDACANDDGVWTTTWPGQPSAGRCGVAQRGYRQGAGTSFASPHVAGVAALLAGAGRSNQQIVDCLRQTSSNRGRNDPLTGYGLVDADAATTACVSKRAARARSRAIPDRAFPGLRLSAREGWPDHPEGTDG